MKIDKPQAQNAYRILINVKAQSSQNNQLSSEIFLMV